ncbi:MAG: C4-dicarboxylate transporter DctA [Verrucomicrobia bacterium]|nr:MAG: C4-dicarboxylate transporter DctA [Verrucomicrobiota bacterium]
MDATTPSTPPAPFYSQLYFWVLVGMILGIINGLCLPDVAAQLKPLSDAFIRMIRMLIAPIIFTTVVVGIAGMDNLKRLGRIGLKAVIYFEAMTTLALVIGWTVAKVLQPGAGMNADLSKLNVTELHSKLAETGPQKGMADLLVEFLLNVIPKTVVGAFAEGEILQVLFFSVLFGIAMAGVGEANRPVIHALDQIAKALMGMIRFIIKLAPFAVFGSMSYTVGKFGIGSLRAQAWLLGCVFLTCICFVVFCLGTLLRLNGISLWRLLRYVREELFIIFGTASSEPVFPRLLAKLEQAGCSRPLVGIVLPAGYALNLDGSSIYLAMGALFIAQATNAHLTFGQELAVLLVSLVTSKGAAAVVGSAFITLAATLSSMKTIPVEGMVLILGVDWFLAMARAMTNMVGNTVATLIVAKWEREFDPAKAARALGAPATVKRIPQPAPNTVTTEAAQSD